jgi:hypothetical protein
VSAAPSAEVHAPLDTDNLELLQRMLLGEATQQIQRPCLAEPLVV